MSSAARQSHYVLHSVGFHQHRSGPGLIPAVRGGTNPALVQVPLSSAMPTAAHTTYHSIARPLPGSEFRSRCVSINAAASMLAPDTHAVRVTGDFKAASVLTTARNGRSAFRLFARHRLKHLPLSGVSPTIHQHISALERTPSDQPSFSWLDRERRCVGALFIPRRASAISKRAGVFIPTDLTRSWGDLRLPSRAS